MPLYEKRGRRYVPVADTEVYHALHNGTWLIEVEDGCRKTLRVLDPAIPAEALALVPKLGDVIAGVIQEHYRHRPEKRPLTAKERRAYKAYCDVMGEDATLVLENPSAFEVGQMVATALAKLAAERITNGDRQP